MISASLAPILLPMIVGISILLMLLRPRNIPEVYWISGGAVLLVVLRLIPLSLAGKALGEGTDVYLFLIRMMLLSELAREHGVFDWLSSTAIKGANGSCSRLFTLVYDIGTLVTILCRTMRRRSFSPRPFFLPCARPRSSRCRTSSSAR